MPLGARELMALRSAVVSAVRQPDNRKMFSSLVAPAFEGDVLHNSALLKAGVRFVLAKEKGIKDADFDLRFHKVGDDRYQAETDLPKKLTLHKDEIHGLIKSALLGISEVDLRLGEMNVHSALSGFTADEVPLFHAKLSSVGQALGSTRQEERFLRVITLAGLPEFSSDPQINIEQVLKIRNEPEAVEFRAWLSDVDKFSDAEILERVASFNAKLGLGVQSTAGKVIRLAVATLTGFAPHIGVPAGIVLGALDQFAWDKFARRSGIAAFINELYPSIFRQA